MTAEIWTILAVGIALGGLMWRMQRSLRHDIERRFEQMNAQMERRFAEIDRKFEQIAECFREVRRQLASLAEDHNALARELSELRGEIRGRLDERARPVPPG